MNSRLLLILIAVAMIAIAGTRMYGLRDRGASAAPSSLAQGRQVYQVWTSSAGPKVTEVVVDPFDPRPGERQTMSVATMYETPVTAVEVVLFTDHRETAHALALVDGRWEGSWVADDTHDARYQAVVRAVAGIATSSVTLTFR